MTQWMTSAEAAKELGVKPATLYAYVSRGLLRSERNPSGRGSRFLRGEVDRLATRGRQRASGGEIVVDSAITHVDPAGQLWYRGREVAELARSRSYEQVAEWLWTGEDVDEPPPWVASPAALRAGRRAQSGLPANAALADRLRVATAAVATTDPLRHDRRPAAVVATTRALIAAEVDCLPDLGAPARADAPIARRLWAKLSPARATSAAVAALDAAMVLVADHELAASTVAARVAASTWADPYMVVLSGMAAVAGPLHGGASEQVRSLLRDAVATSPEEAVGAWLRGADGLPGFGHGVYRGPDPRTPVLLEAIAAMRPPQALARAVDGGLSLLASRGGPHPNIDVAMAYFVEASGMPAGAGEAIFCVARTAGWVAHAIEEYEHRLRFRLRAAYTGPHPAPV